MPLLLANGPNQYLAISHDYLRTTCDTKSETILVINSIPSSNWTHSGSITRASTAASASPDTADNGRVLIPAGAHTESQWLNFSISVHHNPRTGGYFPLPSHDFSPADAGEQPARFCHS